MRQGCPCLFFINMILLLLLGGIDVVDIIWDTIIDGLKILPFLWGAFFIIELLEHRFTGKTKQVIERSGRLGPLLGGILGCFPQCGFSVMATNLYVTRIITLGTLISVYLSTSDEMLPILLAHGTDGTVVVGIMLAKLGIGVISGFIIDCLVKKEEVSHIHELCESDHCHCENGVIRSSLKHTLHTLVFIMIVSFGLNIVLYYGGTDFLSNIFQGNSFLTPILSSLIGLVPNCASSVVLTELYLNGVISFASVIAGLLTGSGVALLVLFRTNKNIKGNFRILLIVYLIGVLGGMLFNFVALFLK